MFVLISCRAGGHHTGSIGLPHAGLLPRTRPHIPSQRRAKGLPFPAGWWPLLFAMQQRSDFAATVCRLNSMRLPVLRKWWSQRRNRSLRIAIDAARGDHQRVLTIPERRSVRHTGRIQSLDVGEGLLGWFWNETPLCTFLIISLPIPISIFKNSSQESSRISGEAFTAPSPNSGIAHRIDRSCCAKPSSGTRL